MKSEQLEATRELENVDSDGQWNMSLRYTSEYRAAVSEELIVVVVNHLKVFMLAGAPLRSAYGLLM